MKYIGKIFLFDECPVPLTGNDIKHHLSKCKSVLVCAATLGEEFDRKLRRLQLESISEAVILDAQAGVELEEFCNQKDIGLIGNYSHTFRFSPGYGDFPLSVNRNIIEVLDTPKQIGLCVTNEYILTPQKSITGIVGIL